MDQSNSWCGNNGRNEVEASQRRLELCLGINLQEVFVPLGMPELSKS